MHKDKFCEIICVLINCEYGSTLNSIHCIYSGCTTCIWRTFSLYWLTQRHEVSDDITRMSQNIPGHIFVLTYAGKLASPRLQSSGSNSACRTHHVAWQQV
jgi:hypothetical protein